MTDSSPLSICVVRLSALGDVLMLVPLIRTLQQAYPQAKLTWVISRPAYDMVEGMQGVDFVVIDKPKGLRDYWNFAKSMRSKKFDVLLATQSSFRANLLYAFIRATRRIGYDALRAKDGHSWFINETIMPGKDHTLRGFLRFADALGVNEHKIDWDLPITAEDKAWAEAHLPTKKPILIINPAASKPERSWDVVRYVQVMQHAKTTWQAELVLTGGPGAYDKTLGDAIASQLDVTNLIGKTKPKQLLACIAMADVLLCPDTGPSHMGAAVGTPVLALHAVTSAEVSGPYVYQHLAVDCYPEAMVKILKQTPQTHVWGAHAHGPTTMNLVTVEAVIQRMDEVMQTLGV